MSPKVSVIMLGVRDVAQAKKFYAEGLGAAIEQDYPGFVKLNLSEGSSSLALYEWDAAAEDTGVSPEGPDSAVSRSTSSPTPARRWTK
jgi:uncharacterized protein